MKKNRNKTESFEEQIVKEVLEDFKLRQFERKSYENTWQLNLNFFLGNQYCYISPMGEIIENDKQYFWQEKEVYNHIANLIEMRQSKLSRVRPSLSVVPFSDDDSDIASAKTCKKILKAVSNNINMSKILSQGTMWSEVCGTVFYKVDWNNNIGRVIAIDENNNDIHEGDVEITVVSPFEIYPDSNTYNNINDCMSIIYARSFHKDAVRNIWGVDVEGQDIDVYTLDSLATNGGLGYTTMSSSMSKKLKRDQVLVLEKYEKPTIEYPNGRLIIVVGDKLIYMGDLPYVNKEANKRGFPFIRQASIPIPNCIWGSSVIERCIPIQRAFNAVKNRKHEFMNRITMGILAVEDGAIDVEDLEEEGLSPGKVLIYRQGSTPPKMLTTESIPVDFQSEENALLNEFVTICGVSDLMNSTSVTSGNISGIALQLLIEQEEIKIITSADEIKNAAKEMAKHILRLYKQFAIESHTSRIIGENGSVELFYWKSSDIRSEEVVFETDNEINESLAQKRSMIFEILKAGLLYDDDGKMSNTMRTKVLEQLGFGVWENNQDIKTLQVNNAVKENLELITKKELNDPIEINDHDIHITEHTAFMLGHEFEKANNKDNNLAKILLDHIRLHKKYKNILKEIEDKE